MSDTARLSVIAENIRFHMYNADIRTIRALEDKAGVPRDTVRHLLSGRTKTFRSDKLNPVAKALGISTEELLQPNPNRFARSQKGGQDNDAAGSGYVVVPRYDIHLAAGDGAFPGNETVVDQIPFSRDWLRRAVPGRTNNLAVVEAAGDSMEPTIRSGDELLIDMGDCKFVDGGVFALLINDTLVVKRVFPSPAGVDVRSDNPAHPSWRVENKDMGNLRIVGRVAVRVGKLI